MILNIVFALIFNPIISDTLEFIGREEEAEIEGQEQSEFPKKSEGSRC